MALITCPDCGAQISESAVSCPHCGCPAAKFVKPQPAQPAEPQPAEPQPAAPQPAAPQPAQPAQTQTNPPCPETHLAKAIVVTAVLCWSWPFGIPAIVNAAGVNSAYAAGNYALARHRSEQANKWANITITVGVICWVLYFLIIIAAALA